MFVVPRIWLLKWRAYSYLDPNNVGMEWPGPITQFELLDHPYRYVHDRDLQKSYTNRYIF